ncbi:hypothetical protein FS749_015293 [Ceratobasidium sp. UAMH 11750]|nr:hypothetical protein FS749_015293 [Ceratobasidium sp. UAMH 11750]
MGQILSSRNVQEPLSPFRPLPNAFGTAHHYLGGDLVVGEAKPLVELEMTRLSAALREKPSWWTKFRDEDVLAKWRVEAIQQAQLMKASHVACYDKIWQSDRLVPSDLKKKLIDGVSKLENVPDSEKDWHPRSNGQVLDLVHPSLYPIVYNRTLAYSNNTGDPQKRYLMPIPPPPPGTTSGFCPKNANYHISNRFQWLPTDFVVSEDGKSVKSLSYSAQQNDCST